MNSIELKITKSTMSVSNIYTLNQGEYNVDKCVFDFSDDYNDLIKKAVFIYNEEDPIEMVILDNECNIPYELLQVATEFTLKVYAYEVKNNELVQRYSPTPLKIFLREGSYQGSNEVITPSQFEQYEAKLDEGLDDVADALDDVNTALQTMTTATEETNRLNIDVSDKVDKDVTITLTKKDNTTKSVVISDGDDFQYNWDGTRLGVKTDKEESYSYVDLQGQQGPMGPQGEAFQIKKTYTTTQEMIADYDNMEVNDYVMISGSVEQQDNATLWVKTETEDPTYKWVYLADFSGASGIQGPTGATPNIQIGNVTQGTTPNVTRRGTDEEPILDFTLVKGDKGDTGNTGATGNGIESIEKTSTSGNVDTYTITFTDGTTTTFDVTNGEDGDVQDVQIEGTSIVDNHIANITGLATQAELDLYKTLYNALPKVSDEGESLTLNNTANSVMRNELVPQIKQNSTTGKQVLNITDKSGTASDGVTYNVKDGIIKLTGTNTNTVAHTTFSQSSDLPTFEAGETYTIYLDGVDLTKNYFQINYTNGSQTQTLVSTNNLRITTFTIPNDYQSTTLVILNTKGGATTMNETIKVMVAKGTYTSETMPEFEPYTGNQPSPSPTYPQQIHTITGDNTIKIGGGKNLIDKSNPYDYIEVVGGSTYTLSGISSTSTGNTFRILNSSKEVIDGLNLYNRTFTLTSNAKYIQFITGTLASYLNTAMLNKGETALPYEPYQSQSKPLNLGDLEYNAIGDYKDEFVKVDGEWFLRKNIGKVVLDGSQTLNSSSSLTNNYRFQISNTFGISVTSNSLGKSNILNNVVWDYEQDSESWYADGSNLVFKINKTFLDSYNGSTPVEKLNNYISDKGNIIFYGRFKSSMLPTTITLPSTLQNQIEDIYNQTLSYQGQTNISQVNNDLAFIVESSALKDMSENSL